MIGQCESLRKWNGQQTFPRFLLCCVLWVKFLARYHHDMDKYSATSDVKCDGGGMQSPPNVGFASNVLPEANTSKVESSQTGVSTSSVSPQKGSKNSTESKEETSHWYALRTTYGREKKAYDYLVAHNVIAFYPTLRSVKLRDGKRSFVEESRIPNIFFAYGTEEELKFFVYDNVNLPYLRFYYRKTHVGNRMVNVPLVVPENQIESLKIICAADVDDIVVASGEVNKFKEGQSVRITEGEFKGVTGKVARYKNHQRVGIIIEGVLTICTAYIPSNFMEIIKDGMIEKG